MEHIDLDQLGSEIDSLRARLAEAEWLLAHLGGEHPLEERIAAMLAAAREEARVTKLQARQQAEQLVREAEHLRAMAQTAAAGGTEQARREVARKVNEMVESADLLRRNAEKQAAELIKEAKESVAPAEARAAELAQLIADRQLELIRAESELADARRQADSIIRHAKIEADARVEDMTAQAKQRLEAARIEAERILATAQERSRY
jgi:hypothetical protein